MDWGQIISNWQINYFGFVEVEFEVIKVIKVFDFCLGKNK